MGEEVVGVTTGVGAVWVGVQAICTAQREVYGYELLHRTGPTNRAELVGAVEHERATAQVIAAAFGEFGTEELAGGRRLFINLTRSFVTGQLPLPFAAEGVVLELLETVDVDHWVMSGLRNLKRRGFAIAVDDFDGETERVPAVALADYVKIDLHVSGDRLLDVIALVERVNPTAVVVVERVETEEQFEACRAAGADLFQGYLFHRPDVLTRPVLDSSHLNCVQLIALLSDRDAPVERVLDLLSADPGLSVRVLKTVSSAAYAPRGGITSLQQAIVLLGRRELLNWAVLVLLKGSGSARVPQQTLTWIFTRAEACRLLLPADPEAASTVGLLSAAAEALGFDLGELTRGCTLQPAVHAALTSATGVLGTCLDAVRLHEDSLTGDRRDHRVRLRGGLAARPDGQPDPGAVPAFPGAMRPASVSLAYLRAQVTAQNRVTELLSRTAGSTGGPTT